MYGLHDPTWNLINDFWQNHWEDVLFMCHCSFNQETTLTYKRPDPEWMQQRWG